MEKSVKIHFWGASGTVTGSKFLLETPELNILIDCGLFQGLKELRVLNRENLPFPPEKIDLVLLTHGHLDHVGYLPKLVVQGFKNDILGTPPTLAVAETILFDSAKIQEEDAEKVNEEGYSSHKPALPLYTVKDVEKTLKYFRSIEPEEWTALSGNINCRFSKNGHIIGSTYLELDIFGKIFVFSGDLGQEKDLLLDAPEKPEWADVLFLESTYGNRQHPKEDIEDILKKLIEENLEKKGTLIIPSFAVERMQTLMYKLWKLHEQRKIPGIPVFIDSPMGNEVLKIFENFPEWHKMSTAEMRSMQNFFNIISSYKETFKTVDDQRSKVIIAGSGMVSGGRVLTYLRFYLDRPETTILLVGFQAEGTRGRQLLEGAQELKIFGKYYSVAAQIKSLSSLSAHADQKGLVEWVKSIKNVPEKVFLIHGEETARDVLRVKLKDELGWHPYLPKMGEITEIIL